MVVVMVAVVMVAVVMRSQPHRQVKALPNKWILVCSFFVSLTRNPESNTLIMHVHFKQQDSNIHLKYNRASSSA